MRATASARGRRGTGPTMTRGKLSPLLWLWTTGALAGLVWGVGAVVVASIAPPQYIPRVFFSYHIEHFAIFYLIAILAAAGLPTIRLHQVACVLVLMAFVLATVRLTIP